MLLVQHNCGKLYPATIAALEAGLEGKAGIICLQEPYIYTDFSHPGYLFYWPGGQQTDQQVLIAVRRDLLAAIQVEACSDLVDHPYMQVLDVWETSTGSTRRHTRIVNCYDALIGASQ